MVEKLEDILTRFGAKVAAEEKHTAAQSAKPGFYPTAIRTVISL